MHTRTETLTLRLCLAFDDDNADVIAATLGEFIGGLRWKAHGDKAAHAVRPG